MDELDGNTLLNRANDFKGSMKKYWAQRYDIFAKYDNGVLLTRELWYSVTPESLSKFTAKVLNEAFKDKEGPVRVMDAFCGGGGNIIQFLAYSDVVYAVDINKIHLHCTYNNASLYIDREKLSEKLVLMPLDWTAVDYTGEEEDTGEDDTYATVQDSILALEKLETGKFDCIFGSPPWGGPDYIQQKLFDLDNLLPFTLEKLLRVLLHFTDEIALFLPKNSDLEQLKTITETVFGTGSVVRVFKMSSQGRAKGLLVCWGNSFANVVLNDISL